LQLPYTASRNETYGWGRGLSCRDGDAGLRPGAGGLAGPRFFFVEFHPEASMPFTV